MLVYKNGEAVKGDFGDSEAVNGGERGKRSMGTQKGGEKGSNLKW